MRMTPVFPDTQRIGDLIGALSFGDGQRVGRDRNSSSLCFLIPIANPDQTVSDGLCLCCATTADALRGNDFVFSLYLFVFAA